MKEFAIRQEVLNLERAALPQVLFVGGHTDDDAMFRLTNALANRNIGVTIATLTDSGARDLSKYTREELPDVRWGESIRSGKVGGVARVTRLESPDGKLQQHRQEGLAFVRDITEEIAPIAIVTLNRKDPHRDHSMTHEIGLAAAGRHTPLYSTDTIAGFDRYGKRLQPDLYIPLTEEIEQIEKRTYLENTSQVTDLPLDEMAEVQRVLDMTARRGREIGQAHSAVLFEAKNTSENPLAEILLFQRAA